MDARGVPGAAGVLTLDAQIAAEKGLIQIHMLQLHLHLVHLLLRLLAPSKLAARVKEICVAGQELIHAGSAHVPQSGFKDGSETYSDIGEISMCRGADGRRRRRSGRLYLRRGPGDGDRLLLVLRVRR